MQFFFNLVQQIVLKTIKEASYIAVNKTEVIQILISVIINKVEGLLTQAFLKG